MPLAAAGDLRAAAPDATFRFPGSAFGIVLGTRRLTEIVGWDRARPLVTEGVMFDAAAARAAGLATEVAEDDSEDWVARRLAPPVASRETLAALREAARADHREADMAALVRSASRPGLKERIEGYRKALAK